MATMISRDAVTHVYEGEAKISFTSDEFGLTVTIDTQRLHIESTKASIEAYDRYAQLFGDKNVMEKYATGETKTRDQMVERIQNTWDKRCKEGDPYSAFSIFLKDTNVFIGHVILGHGDEPGVSEVACLFHKAYWRQGYGTEAMTALVREYAPATVKEGYLLEGKPLEKVVATARQDNLASCRIQEKIGMHLERTEEKFGAQRNHYAISMSQLQQKI